MQLQQAQSRIFKVLMHPTRLAILDILREGEQCVCHMEAVLRLRQAHISQHLMVLRRAGWVTVRRDGWNIFYRVSRPEVYAVVDAATALSGRRRGAKPRAGPTACPCPKCNPDGEPAGRKAPGAARGRAG